MILLDILSANFIKEAIPATICFSNYDFIPSSSIAQKYKLIR